MAHEVRFDWSSGLLRVSMPLGQLPMVINPLSEPKLTWERVHVGATYAMGYERQPYRNLTW